LTHHINLAGLIILSVLGGVMDAFDIPTRQSFVVRMVDDRADLSNAIALNSSLVNCARLIGPSVAGLLIAAVGEGWCFLINGLSYLAVLFSLFCMHVPHAELRVELPSVMEQLRQGWMYVLGSTPIRTLLLLLAAISLVTSGNSILVPIFATQIL